MVDDDYRLLDFTDVLDDETDEYMDLNDPSSTWIPLSGYTGYTVITVLLANSHNNTRYEFRRRVKFEASKTDQKTSEELHVCGRKKDVGLNCWWCGEL